MLQGKKIRENLRGLFVAWNKKSCKELKIKIIFSKNGTIFTKLRQHQV